MVTGIQYHQQARDASLFHGAIADTEPDGWGRKVILRDYAKQRQLARQSGALVAPNALNHLDFLLAVDDTSRVGALRFRDENGMFQRTPEPERRTTPPLIKLDMLLSASRAVEQHTETAADLTYLRGRGTPLGGLRPKCTVIDEDGRLSIGKIPSVPDRPRQRRPDPDRGREGDRSVASGWSFHRHEQSRAQSGCKCLRASRTRACAEHYRLMPMLPMHFN